MMFRHNLQQELTAPPLPSSPLNGNCFFSASPGRGGTTICKDCKGGLFNTKSHHNGEDYTMKRLLR